MVNNGQIKLNDFKFYLKRLYNLNSSHSDWVMYHNTNMRKALTYMPTISKLKVHSNRINLNLIDFEDNPIKIIEIFSSVKLPELTKFSNLKELYLGLEFTRDLESKDLSPLFDINLHQLQLISYFDVPPQTVEILNLYSQITGCKLEIC